VVVKFDARINIQPPLRALRLTELVYNTPDLFYITMHKIPQHFLICNRSCQYLITKGYQVGSIIKKKPFLYWKKEVNNT
jgi:hypothetical protein